MQLAGMPWTGRQTGTAATVTGRGASAKAGCTDASVRLRSAPCAGLLRFPVGTSTGDAGHRPGPPGPAAGPHCGSLANIGPCPTRSAAAAPKAAAPNVAAAVLPPALATSPAQTGAVCAAGRRGSACPVSARIGLETSPAAGLGTVAAVAALCVPVSGRPALMPLALALAACGHHFVE